MCNTNPLNEKKQFNVNTFKMLSNYFKTNTENGAPFTKKGDKNKDLIDTDLSLFGSVAGAYRMLAGQEKASSEAKARKLS